jgi:hypothetical protein
VKIKELKTTENSIKVKANISDIRVSQSNFEKADLIIQSVTKPSSSSYALYYIFVRLYLRKHINKKNTKNRRASAHILSWIRTISKKYQCFFVHIYVLLRMFGNQIHVGNSQSAGIMYVRTSVV